MLFTRDTFRKFKFEEEFPVVCKSTVTGTWLKGSVYTCTYMGGTLCCVHSEDGSSHPVGLMASFWHIFVAIDRRNV